MLWRKKADVNTDVTVCLESFLSRVGSKRGYFIAEKKEKKYNRLITNTLFCFLIRNKFSRFKKSNVLPNEYKIYLCLVKCKVFW